MADSRLLQSLGAALVVVEVGLLWGPAPIRVPAGLVLGLVLPGVVITRLLGRPPFAGVERLLMVPGISIATALLAGLCLNAARIHLTTDSWAVALGSVTAVGLAILAVSERGAQSRTDLQRAPIRGVVSSNFPADFLVSLRWWCLQLKHGAFRTWRGRPIVVAGVALILSLGVAGAIAISASTEHYHGPGFTELWALPGAGPRSTVRVGVLSHELHEVRYRIQVSVDGGGLRTEDIALRPGQTWQSTQSIPRGSLVDITLKKSPGGPVYRRVRLWSG
jgi:uncharacterized membrane protein